jgi:hypothetical protein
MTTLDEARAEAERRGAWAWHDGLRAWMQCAKWLLRQHRADLERCAEIVRERLDVLYSATDITQLELRAVRSVLDDIEREFGLIASDAEALPARVIFEQQPSGQWLGTSPTAKGLIVVEGTLSEALRATGALLEHFADKLAADPDDGARPSCFNDWTNTCHDMGVDNAGRPGIILGDSAASCRVCGGDPIVQPCRECGVGMPEPTESPPDDVERVMQALALCDQKFLGEGIEYLRALARAAIAAQVPAGWQLVPVEPPQELLNVMGFPAEDEVNRLRWKKALEAAAKLPQPKGSE